MSEIRGPQDWREGDLAFCIEAHNANAAGDIRRVRAFSNEVTLYFGAGRSNGCGDADKFARVLTKYELATLPVGADVYCVSSTLIGPNKVGWTRVFSGARLPEGNMYALKSLPEPVHTLKVGDWVVARNGSICQVERVGSDTANLSDGYLHVATTLTPITEQEAKRMLALKDIEDARAKLAEAEARLNEMGES